MYTVFGPYYILTAKINGEPHYYHISQMWVSNKSDAYKFGHPGDAKKIMQRWHNWDITIERCFHWLPPLKDTDYSEPFWDNNADQSLDFDKFTNDNLDKIIITQGQVQIVLPESELIRLFGWYFELEDHNAVLELVEKVDR